MTPEEEIDHLIGRLKHAYTRSTQLYTEMFTLDRMIEKDKKRLLALLLDEEQKKNSPLP